MEIKILCPCGAKFKFDVEPVNGQSPGAVHCPSCGKDSTEATNAAIRQQVAAAVSAAPASPRISVPAAPAGAPNVSIPAIRIPSAPSAPASTPASAPVPVAAAPAVAAPAGTVGQKVTVMPVPTTAKAFTVKPPGEATEHASAPAAPAPANAAGDPKAPGSPKMAFMPVPAAGTGSALSVSGPHGKAEEKPAEAAVATAHAPVAAHPAAAKMARPTPPPSGGGSFGMGVTGAIIGCLVGAALWYFLALNFVAFRFWAWLPGLLGGILGIAMGKKPSEKLAITAAVIAGALTLLTQMAVISGINDKRLTDASEASFKERMALARKAADAKTDAQLRDVMGEDSEYSGGDPRTFKEALAQAAKEIEKAQNAANNKEAAPAEDDPAIAKYRKDRLPALIKFSKGDPSRSKFIEKERTRFEEEGDILYRKRYISMAIWIFSSIESAFLLCRGKKKG